MTDPKPSEASGGASRSLSSAESPASQLKSAADQASASLRAGVEEAKAQVREGADAVRTGLSSAAEQAKAQAADIATQAKQRAYDIAEDQKQVGAEGIAGVARAVRTAADELEDTAPGVARYVQDAASVIDQVSGDLKRKSVDDLLGTVEHFARSQPVAFFGGAVLAGFVLARFIKSSADRRAMAQVDAGGWDEGRSHPLHLDTPRPAAGSMSSGSKPPQTRQGGDGAVLGSRAATGEVQSTTMPDDRSRAPSGDKGPSTFTTSASPSSSVSGDRR